MNNNDNGQNSVGRTSREPAGNDLRPAELPRSEPFSAADLPPSSYAAMENPSAHLFNPQTPPRTESTWRTGAPPDRPSGEVPTSGGPPPAPQPADDTTIGSLGDEPMGGVPREAPPQPLLPPQQLPQVTIGRVGEELFAWLKTLASAAVYATLIVTFGFQVARVEGQSMAPTLADQDRLIVNKLAYRIGNPQVGDIVMLYYPLNPEKSFVKRVIAEEGDQIRIVDGRAYRNDVPINADYVPPEFQSHDDYGPQVVPQGYYFVMGDHRNNSSDSRHWGFVPKKYIIGRVQLRWWPIPTAHVF
jgi:signal peptidase I